MKFVPIVLEKQFTKYGYNFNQLLRCDDVALYEVEAPSGIKIYEVIRIGTIIRKVMQNGEIFKINDEVYPRSGGNSKTTHTLKSALLMYEELLDNNNTPSDEQRVP